MPRRSPSRPGAVYRIAFGVTKEERDVIRATADWFDQGIGELIWLWIHENVEHYAEEPSIREWIANRGLEGEEPKVSTRQELTKEEVLEIIED